MNFPLADCLLADRNTMLFRNMGSGFRDKQNFHAVELLAWVGVLAGVFLALAIISRLASRRERYRTVNSPRALFRSLCRLHALDAPCRRLLKQLAAAHGLAQPAHIFLRRDCFDAANTPAALSDRAALVAALRARLFGARDTAEAVRD